MKHKAFRLEDLAPQTATLELSELKGAILHLKKFSLRERIFVNERWPNNEIERVFSEVRIGEIAELAYRLLAESSASRFINFDNFCEHIVTQNDQLNVVKACIKTIGIGEPELEALQEMQSPKKKAQPRRRK